MIILLLTGCGGENSKSSVKNPTPINPSSNPLPTSSPIPTPGTDMSPLPNTPTPSPLQNSALKCITGEINQWTDGYVINNIRVINNSNTLVQNWKVLVQLDQDVTITNFSNASTSTISGRDIVFSAVSYNSNLPPNSEINFHFQGAKTATISQVKCSIYSANNLPSPTSIPTPTNTPRPQPTPTPTTTPNQTPTQTPSSTPSPTPVITPIPNLISQKIANGKILYNAQCLACHGANGQTSTPSFQLFKLYKTLDSIKNKIQSSMPVGNSKLCQGECADNTAHYIVSLFNPESFNPKPLEASCEKPTFGKRTLKILTRQEYQNTLEDLVGINFDVKKQLPVDPKNHGFDNNISTAVSELHFDAYLTNAEKIAAWSEQNQFRNVVNCNFTISDNKLISGISDMDCQSRFLDEFATRALRRPLTFAEKTTYSEFFSNSLSNGSISESIKMAMVALITSPQFLYRSEMGMISKNTNLGSDVYELTPFEMATFLSYTFTGSTPDITLINAATNDQLKSKDQILVQVDRLLAMPRAKTQLGKFVTQWLKTDGIENINKDLTLFPEFTQDIRQSMDAEIKQLFTAVFYNNEPIQKLFDNNVVYVNDALAHLYGFNATNNTTPIDSSNSARGGLLTTGAFLATHSDSKDSSPIRRAVTIREQVLCHTVPPPPNNIANDREIIRKQIEANGIDLNAMTTRERVALITNSPGCAACHKDIINPLGFGLEEFNAIGQLRFTDKGKSIDNHGQIIGINSVSDGQLISFQGAKELGGSLGQSDQVISCLSENVARFSTGLEISQENACVIKSLVADVKANDNSLQHLFRNISVLDMIRYRR